MRNAPSHPVYLNEGLGPKKTIFVMITVVGCVAILWPKVFHPMMFGETPTKPNIASTEYRGGAGLRQERPSHLRPEGIHPAMRERGRAIPNTMTVPIVEKAKPRDPPRIVDGRPGPIPGMRPPMGAGSVHQAQPKGSSMGFIMPLYTVGIIVFFVYTIMKIMFKKPVPNAPYGAVDPDPKFRKEVFGEDSNVITSQRTDDTKLGEMHQESHETENTLNEESHAIAATTSTNGIDAALSKRNIIKSLNESNPDREQLMEIEKLRKKLEETEKAMAKLIEEMNTDRVNAKDGLVEHSSLENSANGRADSPKIEDIASRDLESTEEKLEVGKHEHSRRERSAERTVTILGMELTASCEGGRKWGGGRPPTPIFYSRSEHSTLDDEDLPQPQAIFLEGSLPSESQILVADAETHTEEVSDQELNGSHEEPAVVLSSKMTLSLINLSPNDDLGRIQTPEVDSPLGDDIEFIENDPIDIKTN